MPVEDYRVVGQDAQCATDDALSALAMICFGDYGLVAPPTPSFMQWYRGRPGMDRANCLAALGPGGEIASSLFITDVDLWAGGRLVRAAAVDTVMTHPDHRKRGLASRLLSKAADDARDRGRDQMVLFTGADSGPERLYASLGFRRCARIAVASGSSRGGSAGDPTTWRPLASQDEAGLAAYRLLTDGFRPYTAEHCRWVRESPASYLVGTLDAGSPTLGQSVLVARTHLSTRGSMVDTSILVDPLGTRDPERLSRLLSSARSPAVVVCHDAADAGMAAACSVAGLAVAGYDVAMALPLSSEVGPHASALWYPITESVIGF